jgi:hypothetical protein
LSKSRTRQRSVPGFESQPGGFGRRYVYKSQKGNDLDHIDQTSPSKLSASALTRGRQVTVDENHTTAALTLQGKAAGDIGGPFYSRVSRISADSAEVQHIRANSRTFANPFWYDDHCISPVFAVDPSTLSFPVVSDQSLIGKGTTAIARCKPTNNVANLAVDFFEVIHDGLPSLLGANLWKEKTHVARGAGGEYLNSEFGWKPLTSDIRDACYAAANSHRLLSSYEKNSGKIVRRKYAFPVERTESSNFVQFSDGCILGLSYSGCGADVSKPIPSLFRTIRTYRRVWFSGAFTYHLPIGYKSRNKLVSAAAKAGPLLGIELTPEVVWNATPWSWALNWFSNAGDVVSNLSDWATDGLVMHHGYIMEHTVSSVTWTLAGTVRFPPYGSINAAPVVAYVETKRREKATPFGFETSWNGMSVRQLAIAAALGITRVF